MNRVLSAMLLAGIAAWTIVSAAAPTRAQDAHMHQHEAAEQHTHFSAGEPGDPQAPARTVEVTMQEADGKMLFVPDRIEVRRDEQIRFVLTNGGVLEHEFVLGSKAENVAHAEMMKAMPQMQHDDPNGKLIASKARGEIVWKFTTAGEFEFACLIPGHYDAGMHGTVSVK